MLGVVVWLFEVDFDRREWRSQREIFQGEKKWAWQGGGRQEREDDNVKQVSVKQTYTLQAEV